MAKESNYEDTIEAIVNSGLHTMVLALGYKVGIIDAMGRLGKPSTKGEISKEAGLNQRYVEEWLLCMASKGIVQYENSKFTIMNSGRIRKAIHTSLALPMFADCFQELENAMKNKDINTGYQYPSNELEWLGKFSDLSNTNQTWIENNINPAILYCQKQSHDTEISLCMLDFGCGYGKLANELAQYYPQSNIFGTDIHKDAVHFCKVAHKQPNIQFEIFSKSLELLWQQKFDAIILKDVLHDLPDPVTVLSQVRRMLKPQGIVIAFDPNISSNISFNLGKKAAQNHLPYSVFFCLPNSLSERPAVGHGGSWGYEDREQFLVDNGFTIVKTPVDEIKSTNSHDHRIIFKV